MDRRKKLTAQPATQERDPDSAEANPHKLALASYFARYMNSDERPLDERAKRLGRIAGGGLNLVPQADFYDGPLDLHAICVVVCAKPGDLPRPREFYQPGDCGPTKACERHNARVIRPLFERAWQIAREELAQHGVTA